MIRDRYPMFYKGHPKLYFKRMPIFWWTKKWAHARFILRELTSVSVAFFAIILLIHLRKVSIGPEAYAEFLAWLKSPVSIILHVIAGSFLVFHSITWFNLAPKAMVIKVGKNKVPSSLILGMNYALWIIVSVAVIWFLAS